MKEAINKKLIVIIVVFLLILLGLAFLVAKPRFNTFKQRYNSLSESQEKLAGLIAKKESLNKLKKDEARIEAALEKAQNIIPDKKQTSDFIVQLEAGAAQTGNILKAIEMNEAVKKTTAKSEEGETTKKEETTTNTQETKKQNVITFSITLSGNFGQLMSFVNLADSLSRFISFTSVTISNIGGNTIDTKLEGEIYYK